MQYITGTDRTQAIMFAQSLEQIIDTGNEVRLIDLFVESLDLASFHFHVKQSTEGRPPYHPKDLLKLYVYGYLNSVRSSRALEKECKRNVEVTSGSFTNWHRITTRSRTFVGTTKKPLAKFFVVPSPLQSSLI